MKSHTGRVVGALLAVLVAHAAMAADTGTSPIDLTQARAAFSEAKALSAADGGRLWGTALYGPMLLVDPETRAVVTNEPDPQGQLRPQGDVYVGTLPNNVAISDSPTDWSGKRWTMLMWPLQQQVLGRHVTLAHELFHRIQPQVGVPTDDKLCPHLDTLDGRIWVQLEWRALAAALASKGAAQAEAIGDALAFRAHRHALFPGSGTLEAAQELAEGVPEYTGTVLGTPDARAARWRIIGRLTDPEGGSLFAFQLQNVSFVRAFAYVSGPPYGLLLDERLPGWRKQIHSGTDLAVLLGKTVHARGALNVTERAAVYGEAAIRLSESDRAAQKAAEIARYRALLVDGPTFHFPFVPHYSYNFNPSTLVNLDKAGIVYPTFHVTADWGALDVKEGVLVTPSVDAATLPAPADVSGSHIHGQGWTLDLAPGWHVVSAGTPGSYILRND